MSERDAGGDAGPDEKATLGVVVRPATGDDLDGVLELGLRAFPAAYDGVIEPDLIRLLIAKWWTKDALVPVIRGGRALVATQGGRLVGMCSFGQHEGALVIWRLYVHPQAHGRGVGAALLAAVRERAHESAMPLRITYTEGNRKAAPFCARHGFEEIGREEQVGMPELVWMGEAQS